MGRAGRGLRPRKVSRAGSRAAAASGDERAQQHSRDPAAGAAGVGQLGGHDAAAERTTGPEQRRG